MEKSRDIIALEVELNQLRERSNALQLAVSWLLSHHPDGRRFLAAQAEELEGSPGLVEHVALFDELREDVVQWLELRKAP